MQNGSNKTLVEIARVFGVSTVTVSNALNRRKNVSREKAESIRQYALEIGYHPSLLAQSLLKRKTNIIGLCLKSDPSTPWYPYLIRQLQDKMWKENYFLSIFVAHPGIERVRESLKFFAKLQVDALLIGPMGFAEEYLRLEDTLRLFRQVVAFDTIESLPLDTLKVDGYAAAAMAVDYLRRCGHERIGMIGANRKEIATPDMKSRYLGYIDALRRHDLVFSPEWVLDKDFEEGTDRMLESLLQVLARPVRPTAFYCHDDSVAAATIGFLHRRGVDVPRDLSLIGTDNHPIAAQMPSGITTVGFDIEHYSSRMVEILMRKLEEGQDGAPSELIRYVEPPVLIVRDSVAELK